MVSSPRPEADEGSAELTREDLMRQQICAAASGVFDRFGIRRATMDDIAEAAGVSRKTLYNYYENKATLLGEVIEAESRRVAREAREQLDLSLPPAQLIVEAEIAHLESARRSSYVERLLRPDTVTLSAKVIEQSQRIARVQLDYWSPILEPLQAAGVLRGHDLAELVEWLTFVHFTLLTRPATFHGDMDHTRKVLYRYMVPSILCTEESFDLPTQVRARRRVKQA
jgi:AcrR family transcriptional regulator